MYDYGRHQKTYGADLNARCICGTRDVSGFTKENDFMSSWIASLWYTCLSPLTIKKVSAIGAKTNLHLSVRTTSVPFTINLCTRYRYPRNLLSSASGDRAHFHWSTAQVIAVRGKPRPQNNRPPYFSIHRPGHPGFQAHCNLHDASSEIRSCIHCVWLIFLAFNYTFWFPLTPFLGMNRW